MKSYLINIFNIVLIKETFITIEELINAKIGIINYTELTDFVSVEIV